MPNEQLRASPLANLLCKRSQRTQVAWRRHQYVCIVAEGFQGGSTCCVVSCANFYQVRCYPNVLGRGNTVYGSITNLAATTLDGTWGMVFVGFDPVWCCFFLWQVYFLFQCDKGVITMSCWYYLCSCWVDGLGFVILGARQPSKLCRMQYYPPEFQNCQL